MFDNITSNNCDYGFLNFNQFPSDICMELYKQYLDVTSGVDIYNIFKPASYSANEKVRAVNGHLEFTKKATQRDYTPWMNGG